MAAQRASTSNGEMPAATRCRIRSTSIRVGTRCGWARRGEPSVLASRRTKVRMTPEQARIGGLARFAIGITVFNLLGHTILGFEPSGLQLVVTVATAYLAEIALEAIGAWSERRQPLFAGGFKRFVIFLLPAHITGFATSMLVYGGDRLLPYIFAASLAIASKSIFAVKFDGRRRHFMNPSNTGIVVTIF